MTKTYKAAPSSGWIWLVAMGSLFCVLAGPGVLSSEREAIIVSFVFLPLGFASLLLAWWFPTIRYELGPDELALHYGPFRYVVPLKEIQTVSKRNLALSLWSSVRFPGFAMWTVPYSDVGNVFMCATRSLTDILYIVTPTRKYGITPENEEAFLADLQARLKG